MVDKPVSKKSVARPASSKSVAAKPVAKSAPVAKPVAAAKVEAPEPAPAAPVVAKVEAPKPVVLNAEAPKPVVVSAPKPVITTPASVAAAVATVPTPIKTPEPVAARIVEEGKTLMNDTVTKVQETAQKFTADATARATEMFGDVSARAKTAMEKGSKGLEEMVEFSKGNLEAVVASGRVAAKGAQDIAKYSAEYGRKSIEEANATAKKFAAVKSPTEFFALQSEVAKTQLDALVGEASKFTEGYMKLVGEIMQPMQNRYAVAVEKVKTAVAA
jgi:phasin family protein